MPGLLYEPESNWDSDSFKQNFRVEFHQNKTHHAVFSLIGLESSIANAFRRILLSEIPTLAFRNVLIEQNNSVVQDEVLAQRLGLVPLAGNKNAIRWLSWRNKVLEDNDTPSDSNTVSFELMIACTWKQGGRELAEAGETDPELLYNNPHVYARHLRFNPLGNQVEIFGNEPPRPVNPDILLAKLRPGQSIELHTYACKGIGQDHAKHSPVATASYRLLPEITIVEPIKGDDAEKFAKCFPEGVIEVRSDKAGEKEALVKNPFRDTVTRECLRHEEFKDKVRLGRKKDHFIFSVESTGQFDSDDLLLDAIKVLQEKCNKLKEDVRELKANG